ncbi:hypothetical protein [Daejeonella sp.]|uniref:hypothetical protein n=1 Tax=Daejeonella sp. TaxID=2805397 RepID=UPI00272FA0FB|nr:hypothetical protein [Daejeonella sp.]
MNNNGVTKHLIRLRKMTSLAVRLEWLGSDPFRNYKFKYNKVENDFLTENELAALKRKAFEIDRISYVRDIFVFSCYTGLAYVDVSSMTENRLITGPDVELLIKTFRQKTQIPVNVPLLPKARANNLKEFDLAQSPIPKKPYKQVLLFQFNKGKSVHGIKL